MKYGCVTLEPISEQWWLFPHLQGFRWKAIHSLMRFFFLKWRSAHVHGFHFLGQDQSTVAQWAKMTVAECSLMSCMWARFPDRLPHYAWTAQSAHCNIIGPRVSACLNVTCHLHLWQNCGGLLCATAVTWGGTDTEWESTHKVNSGEEHSPTAPARTQTHNLSIRSLALEHQAIPAPKTMKDDCY